MRKGILAACLALPVFWAAFAAAPADAAEIVSSYYATSISGDMAPPDYGMRLDGFFTGDANEEVTFAFDSVEQGASRFRGEDSGYIYTRMGNPTVAALEEAVASLEGGHAALATSSGMAAVVNVFFTYLEAGAHLIGTDAVYGPSRVVIEKHFRRFGVEADFADTSDPTNILAALRRQFAGQVIPLVVNEDEVVREAASFGQPVIEYAPQSQAREDFDRLADWLEDHAAEPAIQVEVMRGSSER